MINMHFISQFEVNDEYLIFNNIIQIDLEERELITDKSFHWLPTLVP